MVLTEHSSILDRIFQSELFPTLYFVYDGFLFRLTDREVGSDIFFYEIHEHGKPDIRLKIVFFRSRYNATLEILLQPRSGPILLGLCRTVQFHKVRSGAPSQILLLNTLRLPFVKADLYKILHGRLRWVEGRGQL